VEKRAKRSADEVSVSALLYRRYPDHAEAIRIYGALPPEERKRAIRLGLMLVDRLAQMPTELALAILRALQSPNQSLPLPPAVAAPSPVAPPKNIIAPLGARMEQAPVFDLYSLEES
jgi:hypothetical protein